MDKLSKEDKIRLQKFVFDPDWPLVINLLSKNAESLKDVGTIDVTQSAETIKAIIAGRQETLKLIENFKSDVEVVRNINSNPGEKPGFK